MTRVLIPLAQGCEELEAITLADLMVRAGFDVTTAGLDKQPVKASRGMMLMPDTDLDTALRQDYDLIVLPGGQPGADNLDNDSRLRQRLIDMAAADDKYIAAICAAPKALAHAGILSGRRATAFPGVLEKLELDDVTITQDAIVRDGNVITSRGPGTAMDFALTLIELLSDRATSDKVEAGLAR
jgi:4-methyl-5(b-hydroxyethyl)-thiazole monophosphate biosynthesis